MGACSLRKGLAETLAVLRLGVAPTLARTLRSTNCIESMISIARTHSVNVKNCQNGNMTAAVVRRRDDRSRGQFRRVNGHLHPGVIRRTQVLGGLINAAVRSPDETAAEIPAPRSGAEPATRGARQASCAVTDVLKRAVG